MPRLAELKTLHFGSSTYPSSERRCEAVARRARALQAEYAGKARRVDAQYCGTPDGQVGPVQQRLQTYGAIHGLVFGAWAEASPGVEQLLTMTAASGATRHWQSMGCTNETAARGSLAWLLRRRWAMTALRENARLKLERLEYVGRGAVAAAERRAVAGSRCAARARAGAVLSSMRGPTVNRRF